MYSRLVLHSHKELLKDYTFYLIGLLITIVTLWFFVAESPSKFGLLSGDEEYWLNDFSNSDFWSYVFRIDPQNPYLSLFSRSLTWVGFELGMGLDFRESSGILLVRLVTFSLLALCISFPLFPPVRRMLRIQLHDGTLFWLLMLSITNSENLYVFNFSYYLIVPVLLLISVINRSHANSKLEGIADYLRMAVCYFVATLVLVNKALIAGTLLVGALTLFCINLQRGKELRKLENSKLLSIFFASLLLIFLTKSEDATLGYSILTFMWAITGVFFAIGSFFLPLVAISLDNFSRQRDLDYLTGAAKLSIFLFGLLIVFMIIMFLRNHSNELSEFKNETTEIFVFTIMLSASIIALSYSQYSAWYVSNWFFSTGDSLFVRHYLVPQACLLYLLILLSRIKKEIKVSGHHTRFAPISKYLKAPKLVTAIVIVQIFVIRIINHI